MPTPIRFHLDENVTSVLAASLPYGESTSQRRTKPGYSQHRTRTNLPHALHTGRVLVTRDHDFLAMASRGMPHAGIVYWPSSHERLGDVIHLLTLLWRIEATESMAGRIEFL